MKKSSFSSSESSKTRWRVSSTLKNLLEVVLDIMFTIKDLQHMGTAIVVPTIPCKYSPQCTYFLRHSNYWKQDLRSWKYCCCVQRTMYNIFSECLFEEMKKYAERNLIWNKIAILVAAILDPPSWIRHLGFFKNDFLYFLRDKTNVFIF